MSVLRLLILTIMLVPLCGASFAQERQLPKVFAFELKDSLGRVVKLEDFEGKALVMDFWFTGCTGCVQVAKMLHGQVMPAFESDTNVVFMSVSIDINFLQWKKSLRKGLYSSDKQVNVFTMGMGSAHPLFKHYNFSGCPQMLIIDRHGLVVSNSVQFDPKILIDLINRSKI